MQLIDRAGLKARGINFSSQHIWRLIKAGDFPKPVKIGGGGRNLFVQSEIDDYLARKVAERDQKAS
ncbi:AlpA family phage regulatory protein [Shinella sp. 838]|uniref:helix-turn-helix transcriptional regulator n=1 Tax=Shinella sp. 838 TaxID=3038164 RepID=UPI00241502F9|nr:AlpA family phage regulatory protein [Shinella sp. 838]MCA0343569.1 AlpA family phage regulatory protein [Pseudomonadota bacterium]MDG4670228.1 AlpA family phage regulatory protein [Shinella sp. 838]